MIPHRKAVLGVYLEKLKIDKITMVFDFWSRVLLINCMKITQILQNVFNICSFSFFSKPIISFISDSFEWVEKYLVILKPITSQNEAFVVFFVIHSDHLLVWRPPAKSQLNEKDMTP